MRDGRISTLFLSSAMIALLTACGEESSNGPAIKTKRGTSTDDTQGLAPPSASYDYTKASAYFSFDDLITTTGVQRATTNEIDALAHATCLMSEGTAPEALCPELTAGFRDQALNFNKNGALSCGGGSCDAHDLNQCMTVAGSDSLQLSGTTGFSISYWVSFPSLPQGNQVVLSRYTVAGENREYHMGIRYEQCNAAGNTCSGPLRFYFAKSKNGRRDDDTAVPPITGNQHFYFSTKTLTAADIGTAGEPIWMNVIFTFDITTLKAKFYVNGQFDSEHDITEPQVFGGTTAKAMIGCVQLSSSTPDLFLTGKLDDLVVHKDKIFSANEIEALSKRP